MSRRRSTFNIKKRKIPEFSTKSIVVLDGDKDIFKGYKNFINLPVNLPPDQLIFETLFNLPMEDCYWRNNTENFNKPVFKRIQRNIFHESVNEIIPTSGTIDLNEIIQDFRNGDSNKSGLVRENFKDFYKSKEINLW